MRVIVILKFERLLVVFSIVKVSGKNVSESILKTIP